jgi:hypothetical protein
MFFLRPAIGLPGVLFIVLAFLVILVVNGFRFYDLDNVPYGAQVDELAGAVTVQCLATEGIDAYARPWPLFSDLNFGTPKPPTFLYSAVAWTRIFGFSVGSLRALVAFMFVAGIVGLFFLARVLLGLEFAVLAALAATVSPWTWNFSRVAFESLAAVSFLVWGLFFLFRSARWKDLVPGAFFLACSMYAYPPLRLQLLLAFVPLLLYRAGSRVFSWKAFSVFSFFFILFSVPLILKIVNGELMGRFNELSIFSGDYLRSIGRTASFGDLFKLFIWNYKVHFSPDFLFLTGDQNIIHSTRRFGLLSWLDMMALLAGVGIGLRWLVKGVRSSFKMSRSLWLVIFLLGNIFLAVIPAALTNEGLPHSLRTIGAWPFMMLLSAFFLGRVCRSFGAWGMVAPVLVSAIFAFFLLKVYFGEYVHESKGYFSFWTREEARSARTDEDWLKFLYHYRHDDYHFRYYTMSMRGLSCSDSRRVWTGLRDYLIEQKSYW